MYRFNLSAISPYLGLLTQAIGITLALTVTTIIVSSILSYPIAKARMADSKVVAYIARAYIEVFRNIPVLILVYVFYFGLAQVGLRLPNWVAALGALTITASAYAAEILRAGYTTIPTGQREAAHALALGKWHAERYVILPQVLRSIIPPLANQFVNILLASAVASLVGVADMTDWMLNTGASTFRYMETFFIAALVYVVLCQVIAGMMSWLETRFAVKGR